MTNRLLQLFQAAARPIGIGLLLSLSVPLKAQFTFTYPGPTNIAVGPTCSASVSGNIGTPVVIPPPGNTVTVSMFDAAASGFNFTDLWPAPSTVIVHWHVEDNMGNTQNFTFSVNFKDLTAPVFDLTGVPATLNVNSVVQVPPAPMIPVTDNCTSPMQIVKTFMQTTAPDTCESGTYTRTWHATDLAGNTATFTQTINVFKDTLPPTVSVFPQNGSAPCNQLSTAYPNWLATQMANFTASDPSGIKIKTNNGPASFPPGCAVPLTVTFKAIDNCDLIFPTTATFTTSDNTPPAIIVAPKDTVAYCSPGGNQLTALGKWINKHGYQQSADACSGSNYLVYSMQIANVPRDSAQVVAAFLASYANGCSTQTIGNQMYNKVRGKVTVQFYVQDACGNKTPASVATFGAIDTLPPVINGVNVSEQCGNGDDQSILNTWVNAHGNATVTDDCSGTTWTNFSWTTSAGQTGNGVFNTGPYPVITAHNCTWYVDVTFRATDECGNIGSKVLRFQILDTQKPVIADYPDTVTLYCPNPMPSLSPVFVSDNCDTSMMITYTAVLMDSLCDGSYTMRVTWSATDDCNNTGNAIQTVLVRDTIGPIFTLVPGPKTFRCDTFVLPAPPVMGVNITATDNCSPVTSITTQIVSGQNPDPAVCGHYMYDITRIFTASDECGNTRTATQVISVVDSLGPVISIQDTTVVCDAPPMTLPATASDVCGSPVAAPITILQVFTPGSCSEEGISTLTWQAMDVCGNTSTKTQQIFIIDTVAPVLTGIPADITVECDAIPAPPANNSFGSSDNCAANVSIVFNETEIRNPDPLNCAHWTNYLIRREWTAEDHCGNTRKYTQTINVQDHTGPVMVPPNPIIFPADNGICGANVIIPALQSLYDQCTSQTATAVLTGTASMVSTTGSQTVDTLVFQWSTPNLPPGTPVVGSASLSLKMKGDLDLTSEYLAIYGENGTYLGKTDSIKPQCNTGTQTFMIPASNLNSWMADGNLVLRLAPSTGVNPVCPGGYVTATLTYKYAQQEVPITLTYVLDNNPPATYPPAGPVFLESGSHTIVYTATDCAGNSSTTSATVQVQDLQPPIVTAPAPFTAYVGQDSCTAKVALPFPTIVENCDVSGSLSQASGMLPLQFHLDDDINGYIPDDILMTVSGLVPNAITNGRLIIRHRGDNADSGEFFNIFDENSTPYPATSYGPAAGECTNFHDTVYSIPAATINNWAMNGTATFKAVANNDVLNYSDFINPCGTLLPDLTDGGQSRIQAVLEYSFAVVTYEVRKNANLLFSGSLNGSLSTVSLSPGVYQVKYIVADINGLEGSATYNITVLDTVKPKAICKPVSINTNPSGLPGDVYVLQPSQINNNSTDNCTGPLAYQLSQQNFPCNLATPPNNIYPITLTVTDAYGNSSSCTTTVQVLTQSFNPSYPPVCEGGVLQLFANPPGGYGSSVYTFKWTNPGNAVYSMVQNPVDSNAQPVDEGLYSVVVTGLTGCTATGLVTVDLANLPFAPVLTANNPPVCLGDSIKLTTATYNGQNLSYNWYSGIQGNSTLITTTPSPQYVIPNPAIGNYQYYVVVAANGCTSVSSQPITVTVNYRPTAEIVPDSINVCAGQQIILDSPSQGPGMTYQWNGPNMFNPTVQHPQVISPAASIHAGTYSLIVTQNGCMSLPATAKVIVRPTPPKPQIQPDSSKVCEFSTIQLTANVLGASLYVWQGPTPTPDTTFTNTLTLSNLLVSNAGNWRVRAVLNGCVSPFSNTHPVLVQAYPDVTANPAITVCEGDTVKLTANSNTTLPYWCWTGNNNYITYTQNPKIYPAVAGTYTYKVVGKTSFGCADSTFVFVNVVQRPVIASISNNAPICADGSTGAVLKAVIQSPNGPFIYTWTGPPAFGTSTDPMPVIAPITTSYNGPYTLTVKDIYGCKSDPATTTINTNPPLLTPMLSIVPTEVCAGGSATITVSGSYPTSATYKWTRPNAPDTITTGASLTILNAQQAQNGMYVVQVLTDTCSSPVSGPVSLLVKPIPAIPVPTADSPICIGETLHFNILNPQMDAVYTWSTTATIPFPPPATGQSPTIPNVSAGNAGNYFVSVNLHGCTAGPGEPKLVVVKPLPKTPNLFSTSGDNVCRDYPGAKISLQIGISSITQNAMYTWYWIAPGGDVLLSGPGLSTGIEITDLSPFPSGPNMFKVIGNLNGCSSPFSNITTVYLDSIPDITPFAGGDSILFCTSMLPLKLNADPVLVGTGKWTQTAGPIVTINEPGAPKSGLAGIAPWTNYQFVWTLSNGSCTNYASDTTNIRTVAFEQAMVVQSLFKECSIRSKEISAVQGQHANGYWSQSGQAGVIISNPTNPTTIVDSLGIGNLNTFYWNLPDIGCGASAAAVTIQNYSPKPYAGPDQTICIADSCTNLAATMLQPFFETGLWRSNDTTLHFGAKNNFISTVCNLKPGINTIYWTTNEGYCGNNSRDTLTIFYELLPTANPDMITVAYGQQIQFNLLANDILSQNFSINLSGAPPPHGSLDLKNSGIITYQADAGFSGSDMFNYIICNLLCPTTACSATTVTINVSRPEDCKIPTLFTPNGDRVNDVFVIPSSCLGEGGDMEVTIFNQWGDQVFYAKPYQNDWDGTLNGDPLPVGTYYSIVKFSASEKPIAHFLIIQR